MAIPGLMAVAAQNRDFCGTPGQDKIQTSIGNGGFLQAAALQCVCRARCESGLADEVAIDAAHPMFAMREKQTRQRSNKLGSGTHDQISTDRGVAGLIVATRVTDRDTFCMQGHKLGQKTYFSYVKCCNPV